MCPIGRRGPKGQYNANPATATAPVPSVPVAGMAQTSGLPGPAPNTAGPHRSDLLNKLDPTVDSMSGGAQVLGPGINPSAQGHRPVPSMPAPTEPTAGYHHEPQHSYRSTDIRGPPEVATGMPRTGPPEGTYDPHSSRFGNTMNPRIAPELDERPRRPLQGHSTTVHQQPLTQPGPASRTAGPHHSNLMNKMDPGVDSKATTAQQTEYRVA